ncbi:GNAT family N-acetyltransferase [Labrys miyagiensis]|uniref:GNAT family N-acetyltransferase n=1 Tax=Labrys miyagiensis TaxID=346912 RepID=A0ABQ6CF03_9HYPH|nr:GNAT family N-acetyltransferase [Labrys miyagiensis]GLS18911.1 GNAT family N-acetyltransferase [Labrys miyagiensis]
MSNTEIVSSLHVLDHPIWSALNGTQQGLAEGGALARRYPVEVAPFAALRDNSAESFAALGELMAPGDRAALCTTDPVAPPESFEVLMARMGDQMIGAPADIPAGSAEIVELGGEDVTAMMELADLTKPGPFNTRTHSLGTFLGIRVAGRLAAMAGERMRPGRYTEITAVCTHPDHRGHGYAQALLGEVARRIHGRGEIPFLHVFSDNHAAIGLYRRLGMHTRRQLHFTALGLASGSIGGSLHMQR